jgi:hypothetical protein
MKTKFRFSFFDGVIVVSLQVINRITTEPWRLTKSLNPYIPNGFQAFSFLRVSNTGLYIGFTMNHIIY